jgi:putative ABC transport system permease protein
LNFFEIIKSALHSLRSNKIRSSLTMLGIIIGISSVIVISMVGKGSQNSITGELVKLADRVITIKVQSNNKILSQRDYINNSDIEAIKKIENVSGVSPSLQERCRVKTGENSTGFAFLETTTDDFENISGNKIIYGRTFRSEEMLNGKKVILVDDVFATRRFGRIDIAGEEIEVQFQRTRKEKFTVIGVFENPMKNMISSLGGMEMYQLNITYKTFKKYISDKPISAISIAVSDVDGKDATSAEVINYLEEEHRIKEIYEVSAKTSPVESFNKILSMLSILLTAVAAISLIVGGIGVMNIMLVSVTERIREIGIRKAIGGKKRDIMLQFLIESVFMSSIGGGVGILFGVIGSEIIGIFINIVPVLEVKIVVFAVVVSSGIGIIFGTYPAKKAADLNPIEALRHE